MTIYFIRAGRNVKIGYTAGDPQRRLRGLQTGNVRRLQLLAAIPGGIEDEQRLHERFARYRISGEWFSLSWPIRSLLRSVRRWDLSDPDEDVVLWPTTGARESIGYPVAGLVGRILSVWPEGEKALWTDTILNELRAVYPGDYDGHTPTTFSRLIPGKSKQIWKNGLNRQGYVLDDLKAAAEISS